MFLTYDKEQLSSMKKGEFDWYLYFIAETISYKLFREVSYRKINDIRNVFELETDLWIVMYKQFFTLCRAKKLCTAMHIKQTIHLATIIYL